MQHIRTSRAVVNLSRLNRTLIVFLLFSLLAFSAGHCEPVDLGIRVRMPPFMWKHGKDMAVQSNLSDDQRQHWKFNLENLDRVKRLGGQWNIVVAYQWVDGPDNFLRLKRIIAEHHKRGLSVALRLIEDPSTWDTLTKQPHKKYRYSKEYYSWVKSVAIELGAEVRNLMISNEIETNLAKQYRRKDRNLKNVYVTWNQYQRLLDTGVRAVHSVSEKIPVLDSGFSDLSISLAITESLLARGHEKQAVEYWRNWRQQGGNKGDSAHSLRRQLDSKDTSRKIELVKGVLCKPDGADAFQLHYYGGAAALPVMLDWVHEQMVKCDSMRPIIATEVGFRMKGKKSRDAKGKTIISIDHDYYDEREHAVNIVRDLATLSCSGISDILYWNLAKQSVKGRMVPLLSPVTKQDLPAKAFRQFADVANGGVPKMGVLNSKAEIYECRIVGNRDTSIVWADSPTVVDLPTAVRGVYSWAGQRLEASSRLTLTGDPVYVEY